MEISINGERVTLPEEKPTLAALLAAQGVESPDMVSVQVNGAFVDKSRFAATTLAPGDEVEFLYFMGGGR